MLKVFDLTLDETDEIIEFVRNNRSRIQSVFNDAEVFEDIILSGFISGRKSKVFENNIRATKEEIKSMLFLPNDLREKEIEEPEIDSWGGFDR